MLLRVILAFVLSLILSLPALAQPCMPQCVLAGGGRDMAGSGMTVVGTLGQPVIGMASDPTQVVWHGFWFCPLLFVSSTDEEASGTPLAFRLEPAAPNPFSDFTRLRFAVPEETRLDMKLYDIGGREVATLADQVVRPGIHTAALSAAGLPCGVYYCRVKVGCEARSIRLVVLK